MQDKISLVAIGEPLLEPYQESLWMIPGEDQPNRIGGPAAYEHPAAVQVFGPAHRVAVRELSNRLAVVLRCMGITVVQGEAIGD